MHRRTTLITSVAAATAASLLAVSSTRAVVQTYSTASGTGALTVTHPGGGFFQNDGQFDDGLMGDFGFSGSDGGFIQEIRADLDGGLTGQPGDHAGFASVDYTGGGNFWFGGLGNDAGPLPSLNLASVLAWADVLAPSGKPFQFRIESDFGPTGNGFVFEGVGAGTWQTVGGTLAQAAPIGNFNPSDPELAMLVAFSQELTAWDTGPDPAAVIRIDNLTLTIDSATWSNSGGGDWTTNANWSPIAPNGAGATAIFGNAISAPSTVNLPSEVFAGTVQFNSANSYTLAGTGPLTMRRIGTSTARIDVQAGNHTIGVPVRLMTDTDVTVAAGNTLSVKQFTGEGLRVQQGTVRMIPNGTADATSKVESLTLAGGSTPTATLDLTNNAFVVDYSGATPLAVIVDQIRAGASSGTGIITTSGAGYAVGYAEASDFGTVPAIFGTVDATAVLLRGTRSGDANLDGVVNLSDFNALAGNFGQSNRDWVEGDFNYDGLVNLSDFNLLAGNFGLSAAGPAVTPDDWAALAAAVPEPGAAALFGGVAASAAMLRRRRGRSAH